MKYLAILRDSLRESLDAKLIYVLLGLSLVVLLLGLSMTFTPLPPSEMMDRLLQNKIIKPTDFGAAGGQVEVESGPRKEQGKAGGQQPPGAKGGPKLEDLNPDIAGSRGGPKYHVESVEALQGSGDGPDSAYRFVIALPFKTADEADKARADPAGQVGQLKMRLLLAEQFRYFKLGDIRAEAQRGAGTPTLYFTLTTEPTPDSHLVWGYEYGFLWGAVPLGGGAPLGLVLFISTATVLWIGSLVTILTSVIVTAFFIPNMLRKGTIDLLLCRPISRPALLVYKYIGGLTFILINTGVAILGMWFVLGVRSGVWANAFLLMIFVYTFFFAILYAASTLFSVLTRSAVASILLTCAVWFVLFLVGLFYSLGEQQRIQEERRGVPVAERNSENAFFKVVRVVHFALPRTTDLDSLGNQALLHDFMPASLMELGAGGPQREPFTWGESITASLAFIVVMLGLSCWVFAKKDY